MPPKKKQSLALSLKKIEAERVNMKLRTDQRVAELYSDAGRSSELVLKDWHSCLNVFCFFITVLCIVRRLHEPYNNRNDSYRTGGM